jgi:cyclophilin family peptidyl-prolyl cis-trans isomerase
VRGAHVRFGARGAGAAACRSACRRVSPLRPAARGAGLFGRQAPGATGTFLALVRAGAYNGTTFSKVLPGRWIQAGRQGSLRMGAVALPPDLPPNADLTAPRAFRRAPPRLAGSHARVGAGQRRARRGLACVNHVSAVRTARRRAMACVSRAARKCWVSPVDWLRDERCMQARPEARALGGARLRHSSPGTVSLAVAENDDDARLKGGRNYRNAEFLVTTGELRPPAPMRQGAAPAARCQLSLPSASGDTGTFEQRGVQCRPLLVAGRVQPAHAEDGLALSRSAALQAN